MVATLIPGEHSLDALLRFSWRLFVSQVWWCDAGVWALLLEEPTAGCKALPHPWSLPPPVCGARASTGEVESGAGHTWCPPATSLLALTQLRGTEPGPVAAEPDKQENESTVHGREAVSTEAVPVSTTPKGEACAGRWV